MQTDPSFRPCRSRKAFEWWQASGIDRYRAFTATVSWTQLWAERNCELNSRARLLKRSGGSNFLEPLCASYTLYEKGFLEKTIELRPTKSNVDNFDNNYDFNGKVIAIVLRVKRFDNFMPRVMRVRLITTLFSKKNIKAD